MSNHFVYISRTVRLHLVWRTQSQERQGTSLIMSDSLIFRLRRQHLLQSSVIDAEPYHVADSCDLIGPDLDHRGGLEQPRLDLQVLRHYLLDGYE